MKGILIIGQIPPPYLGQATMIKNLLEVKQIFFNSFMLIFPSLKKLANLKR